MVAVKSRSDFQGSVDDHAAAYCGVIVHRSGSFHPQQRLLDETVQNHRNTQLRVPPPTFVSTPPAESVWGCNLLPQGGAGLPANAASDRPRGHPRSSRQCPVRAAITPDLAECALEILPRQYPLQEVCTSHRSVFSPCPMLRFHPLAPPSPLALDRTSFRPHVAMTPLPFS